MDPRPARSLGEIATSDDDIPTASIVPMPAALRVPGYELLGELGRGGMGVVYRARHLVLNRPVALKVVLAGPHASPKARARFRAEAEAVARLGHPGIVHVFEVGETDGLPFCALEYCPGGTLDNRLTEPMPPTEAARTVTQLARAIQHAHAHNVVHRDLKPANVLVGESGVLKITDFGLAKLADGEDALTTSGAVMGTPAYMSPEQARGDSRSVGPAADIWALGVILYECLTGERPFAGGTTQGTLAAILVDEPPSLGSRVPRDLATICLKCLRKEPAGRYASADALAEDLARWKRGEPIAARPVGRVERAAKWVRRNPVVALLIGAVAVTLAAGVTVSTAFGLQASEQARQARRAEKNEKDRADEADAARGREEAAKREALAKAEDEKRAKEYATGQEKLRAEELARAEWLLYAGQLAAAQRESENGQSRSALAALTACRWDLRGWEHDHLWAVYNEGVVVLPHRADPNVNPAFSPDGRRIAFVADIGGRVVVADARTGELVTRPEGLVRGVRELAFSGDGLSVLVVGSGQLAGDAAAEARFYRIDTGEPGRTFGKKVTCAAVSTDGSRVATGAMDGSVQVFDAATGKEVTAFAVELSQIHLVRLSGDGAKVAAITVGGRGTVRDVKTGKEVAPISGSGVPPLAISPDGWRATTSGAGASVFDLRTGKVVGSFGPRHQIVGSVDFSPDGRWLAIAGDETGLSLHDLETGEKLSPAGGHSMNARHVAFSPDGGRVACVGIEGTLTIRDVRPPRPVDPLGDLAGSDAVRLAFSPDGSRLIGGKRSNAVVRDWATGRIVGGAGVRELSAVALAPDNDTLAVAAGSEITITTCSARIPTRLRGEAGEIAALAFSPDGRWLASGDDKDVRIWDVPGRSAAAALRSPCGSIRAVAFRPDGRSFAVAGSDGGAVVLETAGRTISRRLGDPDIPTASLAYSRDGRWLAVATFRGELTVYDAETGAVRSVVGERAGFRCVSFSPDGRRIVADTVGNRVLVADAAGGQPLLTLRGHIREVTGLGFAADGRLATGSWDGLRIWDAGPPQHERSLRINSDETPLATAFSPEGNRLLTRLATFSPVGGRRIERIDVRDMVTGREMSAGNARLPGWAGPTVASPDGRLRAVADGTRRTVTVTVLEAAARRAVIDRQRLADWAADDPARHRREADRAESAERWFAAVFHLRRLVGMRPTDIDDLRRRLATAESKLAAPADDAPGS